MHEQNGEKRTNVIGLGPRPVKCDSGTCRETPVTVSVGSFGYLHGERMMNDWLVVPFISCEPGYRYGSYIIPTCSEALLGFRLCL